jgi:FixJ family two-component response regulator
MPDSELVLLIEDKQSFADEVREMLDGTGILLTHVDTLESAAAQELLRRDWLCILLDLNVPPHTGKATVIRARQLTTNSIVVVTGHSETEYEVDAITAGADDYLLKHSIRRDLLIRTIRVSGARHLRRSGENEHTRHLRAQMKVLTEIGTVMTEIRDWMRPTPFFSGFFERLGDERGRKEIGEQVKGFAWVAGRILIEVGAITTALRALEGNP